MDDKQFINHFAVVLGSLVALGVVLFIVASYLHSMHTETDLAMLESMKGRLQPVGKVHVGTVPSVIRPIVPANNQAMTVAASQALDAKVVYDTVCAACHNSGIANAPIYGNKAAWQTRIATGIESIYTSSLNGKGAMPAKGGRPDLSDEEIKSAVDYMIEALK